ncbi:hypothetical protein GBA52_011037, partial [Prunus armeniaca]
MGVSMRSTREIALFIVALHYVSQVKRGTALDPEEVGHKLLKQYQQDTFEGNIAESS